MSAQNLRDKAAKLLQQARDTEQKAEQRAAEARAHNEQTRAAFYGDARERCSELSTAVGLAHQQVVEHAAAGDLGAAWDAFLDYRGAHGELVAYAGLARHALVHYVDSHTQQRVDDGRGRPVYPEGIPNVSHDGGSTWTALLDKAAAQHQQRAAAAHGKQVQAALAERLVDES